MDELIPKLLGLGEIQKVLQNLLSEGISIRDLLTIFETLADHAQTTRDTDVLTEYVRQGLKRAISSKYFPAQVSSHLTLLWSRKLCHLLNRQSRALTFLLILTG